MITEDYVVDLPDIYKDVLGAFPSADPGRNFGDGLAVQSLHAELERLGKSYSVSQVRAACQNLQSGKAVQLRNGVFVHPTELGEQLITKLTGDDPVTREIPPFSPPTAP